MLNVFGKSAQQRGRSKSETARPGIGAGIRSWIRLARTSARAAATLLAIASLPAAWPRGGHAQALSPGLACEVAAAAAERQFGLPAGLLASIGRIESGRPDAQLRRVLPWPYAINADGVGRFFDDPHAALAEVDALQARGVRRIDVGCFQIDLFYHPEAFARPEDAFDPVANATAAARFLAQLAEQSGGFETAVALYHSARAELGQPYRLRVLADWRGVPAVLPAARAPDPFVILIAPAALRISVIVPGAAPGPTKTRLPRVITPASMRAG